MTLDRDAMAQLVHALDMARIDMDKLGKLTETDEVIRLAERYAAFLLCGNEAKDVMAAFLRAGQGQC